MKQDTVYKVINAIAKFRKYERHLSSPKILCAPVLFPTFLDASWNKWSICVTLG